MTMVADLDRHTGGEPTMGFRTGRTWRPITSFAMLLGLALMIDASPAAAQGTPEQRAACEDDAMRLCAYVGPSAKHHGEGPATHLPTGRS